MLKLPSPHASSMVALSVLATARSWLRRVTLMDSLWAEQLSSQTLFRLLMLGVKIFFNGSQSQPRSWLLVALLL